jgi:hypothetical protein
MKGVSAMLPQRLAFVRDIGGTEVPYWTPASLDGIHLCLEPGESVLHLCSCTVSQLSQKGVQLSPKPAQVLPTAWELSFPTIVVITDRRIAFLTTQFDKGGGWWGVGTAGIAVAAAANAVSRSRAAKRSAGKVAIGQVRHEWLTSIGLRYRKPVFGLDTYLHLAAATTAGPAVIQLYEPKIIDEQLARLVLGTVAAHRMMLLPPDSSELVTLPNYKTSGDGAIQGVNPGDLCWPLPGGTDDLIAGVLASPLRPAPSSRPLASGLSAPLFRRLE